MPPSLESKLSGGSPRDRIARIARTHSSSALAGGESGQLLEASIDMTGLSNLGKIPNRIVVGTMLNVEEEVVKASPVDTGRFIASWIATRGIPSTDDPISKQQQSSYRSQGKTFLRKVSYTGAAAWRNVKAGVSLWLVNNVPYGNTLRQGGAPYSVKPGWLEGAVRRGIRRRAKSRNRRNRS